MIPRLALIGLALAVLSAAGCNDTASSSSSEQADSLAAAAPADSQQAARTAPDAPDNGKSVEERVAEASTAARVKIALLETQALEDFTFEPRVKGDRLTLRGDVATRTQREKAADVAEDVDGVDEVTNKLLVAGREVKPPEQEESPEQIAEAQTSQKNEQSAASSNTSDQKDTSAQQQSGDGKKASSDQKKKKASSDAEYYTVKSGDSLWNIARKHDTSVSKIKQLNNLSSNSLHPGDELRVR
jgi:LysM repeat protein